VKPKERQTRIGLFIPCYIDAFFAEVGIATLELLERFGHEVDYPRDQTCCGQPMANSGFKAEAADTEALFVGNNFDAIEQTDDVKEVRARTFELVEFLHDIQRVDAFPSARLPHRVGLHNSCGTLRRLPNDKVRAPVLNERLESSTTRLIALADPFS
jgi:L-lactate dehydrogenase complex protein LldE